MPLGCCQFKSTQMFVHLLQWNAEGNQGGKSAKNPSCIEINGLESKAKAVDTNKTKQGIPSPLPMGRQVSMISRKTGFPTAWWLLGKANAISSSSSLLHLLSSYSSGRGCVVWNVPLVSQGPLSQLHQLPAPCSPPFCSLLGSMRSSKDLGAVLPATVNL